MDKRSIEVREDKEVYLVESDNKLKYYKEDIGNGFTEHNVFIYKNLSIDEVIELLVSNYRSIKE